MCFFWQYNGIQKEVLIRMNRNAFIRTRTDSFLKEQAELVFSRLGINMTDAINLFLAQVTLRNALPFDVSIPSSDTEFHEAKEKAFEERKIQLNLVIEAAEEDYKTGRILTPEESKLRTRAKLESLEVSRKKSRTR